MPTNTGEITGLYGVGLNDTIVGNVFEGFLQAIWFKTEGGSIVSNNTFYDNSTAIYHSSASILNTIRNNIFWGNSSNITNVTATYNSNNLTTNPIFVDASSNNFNLQYDSPAIDIGYILPYLQYDLYGTEITTPDIGAVEYVP